MHFIYNLNNPLQAWDSFLVIKFRKHIKNDTNFYQKYLNLIKNLDKESVEIINNIVDKICNYNNII